MRLSPTSFYRENECIGRIGEWEVFWLFELGEKSELNCIPHISCGRQTFVFVAIWESRSQRVTARSLLKARRNIGGKGAAFC